MHVDELSELILHANRFFFLMTTFIYRLFLRHPVIPLLLYLFIILFIYILVIDLIHSFTFFSLIWCVIRVPLDLSQPRLCLLAISLVALS